MFFFFFFLKLESSLISFAGSDSPSTWQGGGKRKRRWREGWEGGRLFERGSYFKFFHQRGVIIRGTCLIEGRLPLEEIRYIKKLDISKPFVMLVKILSVPWPFGVISRFQCNYKAHIKTYLFKPLYWWAILYSVLTCMHIYSFYFLFF